MTKVDYWMWRSLQEVKMLRPDQELYISIDKDINPEYVQVVVAKMTKDGRGMLSQEILVRKNDTYT